VRIERINADQSQRVIREHPLDPHNPRSMIEKRFSL